MHRHGSVDSFPDFGKEWTDGCFSVLVMDGLGGLIWMAKGLRFWGNMCHEHGTMDHGAILGAESSRLL